MALLDDNYLVDIAHSKDLVKASDGDLATIRGRNNVKEALLRRLITQPGSLAHRPNYGVGIKDFQNKANTIDNQRALALRIKEQFEQDFRVEKLVGMKATVEDDRPELLIITVRVILIGRIEVDLTFKPFGSN